MKYLVLSLILLLGTGCATRLDGTRYLQEEPAFDLFAFFEGSVDAWGIVQNRGGEVVQRFSVEIVGRVNGDRLTLDERFVYAQGEGVEQRTWVIERRPDGSFAGTAGDILGSAAGVSYGNAFRWTYAMDLPAGDRTYQVRFDDWIFALDERRIVNRSYIQKFGLDVAEVTIFMQRRAP